MQRARVSLSLLAIAAIAIAALWWWFDGRWHATTDDAFVRADLVRLAPQISGIVVRINTGEAALVRAGEPVIELDRAEPEAALADSEEALALTVRRVRRLFGKAGSPAAKARLRRAVNDHPDVALARARLLTAYLAAHHTSLIAPVSGYVDKQTAKIGQQVGPDTRLLSIVPLADVWVEANFSKAEVAHLRIGQPGTLSARLDGRTVKYEGHVAGSVAAPGSAQRIRVRIQLDPDEVATHRPRPGQPINVSIDTRDCSGPTLADVPPAEPATEASVYDGTFAEADRLATEIVDANLDQKW